MNSTRPDSSINSRIEGVSKLANALRNSPVGLGKSDTELLQIAIFAMGSKREHLPSRKAQYVSVV